MRIKSSIKNSDTYMNWYGVKGQLRHQYIYIRKGIDEVKPTHWKRSNKLLPRINRLTSFGNLRSSRDNLSSIFRVFSLAQSITKIAQTILHPTDSAEFFLKLNMLIYKNFKRISARQATHILIQKDKYLWSGCVKRSSSAHHRFMGEIKTGMPYF